MTLASPKTDALHVVDGGEGVAVYLGGVMFFDGVRISRAVIKVMDFGEGSTGPGPDRESYLIHSSAATWGINDPNARHLMDTPSAYRLTDWFETVDGNIQVHNR